MGKRLKMDTQKVKDLFIFAKNLSIRAGNLLLKNQSNAIIKKIKGKNYNYATNIDFQVDHLIIQTIQNKYPDHQIYTEETGILKNSSNFRWVIDPLDGTWLYKNGLDIFGTIIALEKKKELIFGVFNQPKIREFYSVIKNQGFYRNSVRSFCNTKDNLDFANVFLHYSRAHLSDQITIAQLNLYQKLIHHVAATIFSYSTSFDLCYLAQGSIDAVIRLPGSIRWWDVASGILMVKEAGGKVTTLKGKEVNNANFEDGFLASNGKIHEQLLKIINS